MVAPITGPFVRSSSSSFPTGTIFQAQLSYEMTRTWYRQRAPFDRPLKYDLKINMGRYSRGSDSGLPAARTLNCRYAWISTPSASSSNAYTKAWSQFNEKLKSSSEWAVSIAQYRQSFDALVGHLTDLYGVFRDIKRGHFGSLYSRFKPPKGFKMKGKTVADKVLEWRFGWQPLWNDIHSAAEALSRDLGDFSVVGKGRGRWVETDSYTNSGMYSEVREDRIANYDQRYRLSADVRITNPNLLLWDSLGFTNPVLFAYELIPFSFVLNYFVSLEEFCRGLCPFMGMELRNACTTHFTTVKTSIVGTPVRLSYPYPNPVPYGLWLDGVVMSRAPGPISGPPLRIRDPWILQPGRAVNSVSLLLQQLGKRR